MDLDAIFSTDTRARRPGSLFTKRFEPVGPRINAAAATRTAGAARAEQFRGHVEYSLCAPVDGRAKIQLPDRAEFWIARLGRRRDWRSHRTGEEFTARVGTGSRRLRKTLRLGVRR